MAKHDISQLEPSHLTMIQISLITILKSDEKVNFFKGCLPLWNTLSPLEPCQTSIFFCEKSSTIHA